MLLCDKRGASCAHLAELLEAQHYSVRVAYTKTESEAELVGEPPDLLITGPLLPGRIALEVVRRLRSRSRSAVCLLLATKGAGVLRRGAEAAGADQVLEHPVGADALAAVVRGLLVVRDLRNQLGSAHDPAVAPISQRDAITGFHTFEYLKELLFVELKRAQRYRFPVSLMLVSIDTEKKHPASQERVQLKGGLALAVSGAIRDTDLPAALGNGQILVFMPHTEHSGASIVARRILFRVARSASQQVGSTLRPRVAIGLAASTQGHLVFSELVHQAMLALAQAQGRGGNCVLASEPASSSSTASEV